MPRYQRSMCVGGQDNGLCEGSGPESKCAPAWGNISDARVSTNAITLVHYVAATLLPH